MLRGESADAQNRRRRTRGVLGAVRERGMQTDERIQRERGDRRGAVEPARAVSGEGVGDMAIKNYTTKVDVYTSIGEIQGALARHGATKIMIDYDNGKPQAIAFGIDTPASTCA